MRLSLLLKLLAAVIWVLASCQAQAGTKPWAGSDYVDLYFRIYNGQVPLPHLRDEKQKALFDHLIDSENLARIQSASVPAAEKLRQLEIIFATLGAYRAHYNYAVVVGEPLEQELAMIQAYQLQVLGSMAKLSPNSGLTGASHASWATLMSGVISSVANRKIYSPRQNAIMADAFARNYSAIAAALTSDERNLVRAEVSNLNDADDNAVRQHAREQIRHAVFQ